MVALEEAGNLADSGSVFVGASCAVGSVCTSMSANAWLGVTGGGTFNGPQRWPDVTAALQWNFPNGAVYASGVVGQLYVDNGGVTTLSRSASTFKWGAALGARYNFGRVEIGGQGHVGDGIGGKYAFINTAGFTDAVLVRTGTTQADQGLTELASVLSYSGSAYMQVKLTDTVRATASYSWGITEVASEVPSYYGTPSANSKSALTGVTNIFSAVHGNVLWNPVPQATFGVEYAYQFAAKYNAGNLHVQRLQFSAIYRF